MKQGLRKSEKVKSSSGIHAKAKHQTDANRATLKKTLPDTPSKKGEKTRASILKATSDILCTNGINGITVINILKKAGVSKGVIYHHFDSIDEIIFEALGATFSSFFDELNTPKHKHKNLEGYLKYLGETVLNPSSRRNGAFKAFYSLFEKSIFDKRYRLYLAWLYGRFSDSVQRNLQSFANSQIKKKRLVSNSLVISVLLEGLCMHSLAYNDPQQLETIWNKLCLICLNEENMKSV